MAVHDVCLCFRPAVVSYKKIPDEVIERISYAFDNTNGTSILYLQYVSVGCRSFLLHRKIGKEALSSS